MPVGKEKENLAALRTNHIAVFITIPTWKIRGIMMVITVNISCQDDDFPSVPKKKYIKILIL